VLAASIAKQGKLHSNVESGTFIRYATEPGKVTRLSVNVCFTVGECAHVVHGLMDSDLQCHQALALSHKSMGSVR
jgi:hypothetical protein